MTRIIFIITYMGQFPWYFPYFLHSCRNRSAWIWSIDSRHKRRFRPHCRQPRKCSGLWKI